MAFKDGFGAPESTNQGILHLLFEPLAVFAVGGNTLYLAPPHLAIQILL